MHVRFDQNGLPIVEWNESRLTMSHVCRVEVPEHGDPQFTYHNPRPVNAERNWETLENRSPGQHALALLDAVLDWRKHIKMAFVLLAWLAIGVMAVQVTGEFQAFVWVMFILPMLASVVVVPIFAVRRLMHLRKGLTHDEAVLKVPWNELSSFRLTDERSMLGHTRTDNQGRELPPRSMLVADFGAARAPMEISTWFDVGTLSELHRILSHEFIERRVEHLERLAAAKRKSRAEAGVIRQKVF